LVLTKDKVAQCIVEDNNEEGDTDTVFIAL